MMLVIKCKNNGMFAACVEQYADAEWKLQEAYYVAQGCKLDKQETAGWDGCECEHCESLEHKFEELIEEVRNN